MSKVDIMNIVKNNTSKIRSILRIEQAQGSPMVIDSIGKIINPFDVPNVTLGILKPDSIARNLENDIYARIDQADLEIIKISRRKMSKTDVDFLYPAHAGKNYYQEIVGFMTSHNSEVFMVLGENALDRLNKLVGSTDPSKSPAGTIRGDFYARNRVLTQFPTVYQNNIHSSSLGCAVEEIRYFLTLARMPLLGEKQCTN